MSTVALSRPGTVATALISGTAAGSSSGTFKIFVQDWEDNYEVRTTEVTGDGHTAPVFQHGALIYGQFRLSGYMVAGSAIGIANLSADINGGYGATAAHTLQVSFESGLALSGSVLITSVRRGMSKKSPHVRLAISGVFTGSHPSETALNPPTNEDP
jgi:hypothetical protein